MKNLFGFPSFLCAALLLTTGATAFAEVYKWVDKDGKIQYSDQPPLSGEAKKIKQKTKNDAGTSSAAAPGNKTGKPALSVADQELEYRKRKNEKEEAEKKLQAEKETAKQNKDYCNNLRGDLSAHANGKRIVRYDEKGEAITLDEKERAENKKQLEAQIAKECKQ